MTRKRGCQRSRRMVEVAEIQPWLSIPLVRFCQRLEDVPDQSWTNIHRATVAEPVQNTTVERATISPG